MKTFVSAAVAALISESSAVDLNSHGKPDVWGPNGTDYENNDPRYDFSRIGISYNTHAPAGTAECRPGDWVSIHYKAKLSRDLREVSDTRLNPGTDKQPVNFLLGASDTFKCLDLGIQKLHKGDNATLSCPSFYAWGGARTEAPLGGGIIPYNSDITFEVEVLDCNREKVFDHNVTNVQVQPKFTTMQPDRCMYLHLEESN